MTQSTGGMEPFEYRTRSLFLYARLLAVAMIWGATFVAGHDVARYMSPALAAFLRYVIASATLLVAVRLLEGRLPRLKFSQLLVTMALGATGILSYNLLFFSALKILPASRTSLIVALNPVVTIILSVILLGERFTARRAAGILMALIGVWIVISKGSVKESLWHTVGSGELYMLAAVCSWAAYTLIGRVALKDMSPVAATTAASLWGTLMLLCVAMFQSSWGELRVAPGKAYLDLFFLGSIGTALAFVWYYQGVQQIGASRTVIFNNLVPLFGATFGVLINGETLFPSMVTGGALAISGVFLVTKAASTKLTERNAAAQRAATITSSSNE